MPSKTVQRLSERLYGSSQVWDTKVRFLDLVREHVGASSSVLDLGAGSGWNQKYDPRLKGRCRQVVGLDVDPKLKDNPRLDRVVLGDITAIPLADEAFDVVFSMMVLEHLPEPRRCAAEVYRILKPGGRFLVITPNIYHYVSLAGRLTPHWFHRWYSRKMWAAQREAFPTYYKLNTVRSFPRPFEAVGFETVAIRTVEPMPSYLAFSAPTFLLGALYQRIVASSDLFRSLRANIIGVFRRPPEGSAAPAR
jgi:SAM-dependent methyltransferase